jgi:hypothetical protein
MKKTAKSVPTSKLHLNKKDTAGKKIESEALELPEQAKKLHRESMAHVTVGVEMRQ